MSSEEKQSEAVELSRDSAGVTAEQPGQPEVNHRITLQEFLHRRRTASVVYVFDLRDQESFDAGNLTGSYSLPIEYLENNLHRLPFSGEMLFYDGGDGVVLQAVAQLDDNGFSDYYYVEEGYEPLLSALKADPEEIIFEMLEPVEQAKAIEKVLDEKVRDFLARDGGGLELMGVDGDKVLISYQGACGSCPSSTAGTLRYIQSALTLALNHPIEVIPTDEA